MREQLEKWEESARAAATWALLTIGGIAMLATIIAARAIAQTEDYVRERDKRRKAK